MAAKDIGPLTWDVPIVDKQGRPSPEFQRRWNTQRSNNAGLVTAFTQLTDVPSSYTAKGGYVVRVNVAANALEFIKTSDLIDVLGSTRGSLLERGSAGWTGLAPGTNGYFLKSGGAGADPSYASVLVIGFILATGVTGVNVGPELPAPRVGGLTRCVIVTKASDPATALTFKVKQNGVDVFAADPSIPGGTSPGTVTVVTNLTSSPLSVARDDVFTIDVTSGSTLWQATIQLE